MAINIYMLLLIPNDLQRSTIISANEFLPFLRKNFQQRYEIWNDSHDNTYVFSSFYADQTLLIF